VTSVNNRKLRQESTTLLADPAKTWTKVLPRRDLKERFFILERVANTGELKYILANRDRFEPWLKYLVQNHPEYVHRIAAGELEISEEALAYLRDENELAFVESMRVQDNMEADAAIDYGIIQPAVESGLQEHHVLAFDKFPHLYLKNNEMARIRKYGRLEIVTDEVSVKFFFVFHNQL
jgi:hypothetical protein